MNRLWAPWRMPYIKKNSTEPTDNFIARVDKSNDDRENLVVTRTKHSIVILNRYPYANGHLLVAPRRVTADFIDLNDEELLDIQKTIRSMLGLLTKILHFHGANVGINLGKAAGAGLPQHLHWHIVPRWHGDSNFMVALNDTKVLIQSLDELWLQLCKRLQDTYPGRKDGTALSH